MSIISNIILKYRILVIVTIIGAIALMAYYAYPPKFSYQLAKILPSDHQVKVDFDNFTEQFGENNANTITIAVKDSNFLSFSNLKEWDKLTKNIELLKAKEYTLDNGDIEYGIKSVVSITNLPILKKDTITKRFFQSIWYDANYDEDAFERALLEYKNQKIYEGILYHEDSYSSIMLIVVNNKVLESHQRDLLMKDIDDFGAMYSNVTNLDLRYSGLPYIRTKHSMHVKNEVLQFIFLTLLITGIILFLFFKSFKPTIISMIVVVIGVIFSFGSMGILQEIFGGFEINLLTALVPPVIIVIGIPNCIFLINKYHTEYKKSKEKQKSLHIMISKIGNITLLTNLTTASGFAAFIFTQSESLQEFGLVASISIIFIFILSLLIIPIWFSYLPAPTESNVKHLDTKWVQSIVSIFSRWVKNRRRAIYIISSLLIIISIFGFFKVETTGNITDDLSRERPLFKDLQFFEENFGGVMPLEIIIDTKQKKGLEDELFMQRVEKLQIYLSTFDEFSKPISYIDFLKSSYQSYHNGNSEYYTIPPSLPKQPNNMLGEKQRIEYNNNDTVIYYKYLVKLKNTDSSNVSEILTDSIFSKARVSLRMKDISTVKMDSILIQIESEIKKIFVDVETVQEYIVDPSLNINKSYYDINNKSYTVRNIIITGVSRVFLEGTKYLVSNLALSLLLVMVLIAIFMAWMFRSSRMVLISLIPNLIPLIITAAIMGYFSIPIKPSTILVFSIAFGISVDDTIHFLAKYRQELLENKWNINKSVFKALKETGVSMIYTSIVLFFGFFIFVASDFGGTVALGLLVSITLLFAMLSNLLLLPALLLTLEKIINKRAFQEPLLEVFDEEEDIELKKLKKLKVK